MCLYPKFIKNRKYVPNKKNRGNPPPVKDERVKQVPVGCQQCIECRKMKMREWQVRLLEDIRHNRNGKFITLTFSNESISELIQEQKTYYQQNNNGRAKVIVNINEVDPLEKDNMIATIAVRRFLERWRKKFGKSVRHWLVTELGHNGTENIHLHGIIWTDETYDTIRDIWSYGYIWPRKKSSVKTYVNGRTVNYIVKYISKIDKDHKFYKSKILTSAGIGNNYTKSINSKKNKFNATQTDETYKTSSGHQMALPIYWRNKIYTDKEREELWLQKLDKGERYICGEKITVKTAEDFSLYWKLLDWHRKRNKQLGYGDDEKNWNREVYEREKRRILHQRRTAKATTATHPPSGGQGDWQPSSEKH